MKGTWYILIFALALCSCKHTKPETHVSALIGWAAEHFEEIAKE